ncbi:hypothetical protein ACVPOY_08930 [Staphylococcus aureus]
MVEGTIEAVEYHGIHSCTRGLIGVVQASGSFESGLLALTKKTKGHEFMLIVFVSILMIIGGTLCGIEEEKCSILSDFSPYHSVRIRFYRFSWCHIPCQLCR